MAVLKSIRRDNYVQINNEIAQDATLTYEAKGLLLELLSRPANWEIHRKQLIRGYCGDTMLKRMTDELRSRGFLYLYQGNMPIGYLSIWIVSDTPKTESEFLDIVKESSQLQKMPGFIYFLSDGLGNVKIGRAQDWKKRLSESLLSPAAKVWLVIHTNNSEMLEANLHAEFSKWRVKGEWYQLTEAQVDAVRQRYAEHVIAADKCIDQEEGRAGNQDAPTPENLDGLIIGSTKKDIKEESSGLRPDLPSQIEVLPRRVSNKDYPHDNGPYLLADVLLNLIEKGPNPNTYARYTKSAAGREGVIQNLAYSFDMVLRVDGRPINEVMDLLEWCQKDAFWKGNIRSGDSFRRGYNTMLTQMKERGFGTAPVPDDPNPELTNEIIGVYRQLTNEPRFKPNADQLTKFIEASGKCERFFRRHQDVEKNQWMELLRSCMDKNYLNQSHVVFPGHLCSDNTWTILMPQYLAEAGYE